MLCHSFCKLDHAETLTLGSHCCLRLVHAACQLAMPIESLGTHATLQSYAYGDGDMRSDLAISSRGIKPEKTSRSLSSTSSFISIMNGSHFLSARFSPYLDYFSHGDRPDDNDTPDGVHCIVIM